MVPASPSEVTVPSLLNASRRENPPQAVLGAKNEAYVSETRALSGRKVSARVNPKDVLWTHAMLKLIAVANGAPTNPNRMDLGPQTRSQLRMAFRGATMAMTIVGAVSRFWD